MAKPTIYSPDGRDLNNQAPEGDKQFAFVQLTTQEGQVIDLPQVAVVLLSDNAIQAIAKAVAAELTGICSPLPEPTENP